MRQKYCLPITALLFALVLQLVCPFGITAKAETENPSIVIYDNTTPGLKSFTIDKTYVRASEKLRVSIWKLS